MMLKSYRYLDSDHCRLSEFILAFFNRVEFETGDFSMDFFEAEFRPVVTGHREILNRRLRDIYEIIRNWSQNTRTDFCQKLRDSNDIERICKREVVALKAADIPAEISRNIIRLFDDLYDQVLDGNHFMPNDQGRMEHFRQFRHYNNDITLCPFCGISELKMEFDYTRDPYDHYLAKSIYPFSSVNFKNLLPICKECNGLEVKADKDILAETAGRVFYPFDATHKGVSLHFSISRDDVNIARTEWELQATDPDGKNEEIESWKTVYNIESRYVGFVKGRIAKWHRHYWEYMHRDKISHLSDNDKYLTYHTFLELDEENHLNFIRMPALDTFVHQGVVMRAEMEAHFYS